MRTVSLVSRWINDKVEDAAALDYSKSLRGNMVKLKKIRELHEELSTQFDLSLDFEVVADTPVDDLLGLIVQACGELAL